MAETDSRQRDFCEGYCFDFGPGWAEVAVCDKTRFLGVALHKEGGRDVLSQHEARRLGQFLLDAAAWLEFQFDKSAGLPNGLVVYVISDGSGHYKIGKAVDVRKRLRQLQTGNGRKLEVVAYLPCSDEHCAYEVERRAQHCLSERNSCGEWFACSIDDAVDALNMSAKSCGVLEAAVLVCVNDDKLADDRRHELETIRDRHLSIASRDHEVAKLLWEVWCALVGVSQEIPGESQSSLVQLLKKYSFDEIATGMKVACEKHLAPSTETTANSGKVAFNAIAKCCRIARINREDPVDGRRRYIIGILRNRVRYLDTGIAAAVISDAISAGVDVDYIEQAAKIAASWSEFREAVSDAIEVVFSQGEATSYGG